MFVLEIAGGIVIAVLILLFLAYWVIAGLNGGDGAGYCSMIAVCVGSWFFSATIGMAVTALIGALFVLLALRAWADRTEQDMEPLFWRGALAVSAAVLIVCALIFALGRGNDTTWAILWNDAALMGLGGLVWVVAHYRWIRRSFFAVSGALLVLSAGVAIAASLGLIR